MSLSVKTGGGEKLKFIKSSYRCVNGHTHTHISTHQQDFSPTHIPQQNTHCVIAPFVHFSHPPAISASTSHIGSLILTLVLTSVTELPSHRPSSLVQLCTTWEKCSAHILPNTKAFSKYSENFGPIWQHCNGNVLTSLHPWTALTPPPHPPPPSMKSSCPTIAAPSDEFPMIFFFNFYTVCVDVRLTCSPAIRLPPHVSVELTHTCPSIEGKLETALALAAVASS